MSAWASLSGYLYVKPGGGGLSFLKTRKRLWCILEESQGRLLYFKSEEESRSKAPLGHVDLCGAAITLDMDNHNQFVIIVDNKEILLTAENHESMMIWLLALQARRDQFAEKSRTSSTSSEPDFDLDLDPLTLFLEAGGPRERSASDLSLVREHSQQTTFDTSPYRHRPLEATKSLQGGQWSNLAFLGRSPEWRRDQLKRMGATVDRGHEKYSAMNFLAPPSRQMSLSMEMAEMLQRTQHSGSGSVSRGSHAETKGNGSILNWSSSTSTSTDTSDEIATDSRHRMLVRSASLKKAPNSNISSSSARGKLVVASSSSTDREDEHVSDLEKELIATKCELAKVLNRQTTFQEILMQKDEIIEDLDEKLGNRGSGSDGYDSKKRVSALSKEHQERVRVLQNQNRFLNEEVRRLAKLKGQEHEKIRNQELKVRSLEADIEVWKLEYISLIQSSIRFTGADTIDDAELSLFGGDRHKHRILSLLEEARKINPSLPTYEHLASGEVHVDSYGFKHHFIDDGLLLHYLCQELSQHFLTQASSYEKHQKSWLIYLKANAKCLMANVKELKSLVRAGIPDQHRRLMWRLFVMSQVDEIMLEKGAHYYRSLCSAVHDSPLAARYKKQISLDLMRTMPSNVKFSTPGSKGIMDLQDVLLAFCLHNPGVGYCQGMNFLVAMALLFMDAQDAFWLLVAVTERYHSPSYFDHNLLGAQADQSVLHDLMGEKMPELAKHLDAIDIEISTVTLNWFLALFFDAVPFQTLLRIWDIFLLEGPKVLFRFSLAILNIHSKEIIQKCDTISVMRHLKACARISYDVDGLVQVAFKNLKPFPRRQDIVSKQTFYLNSLKEKYRWREMQRVAFQERENAFLSVDSDPDNYTGFECCTIARTGEAWVCYGDPPNTKVCIVDCAEQTMTDTDIHFDTRVMCMTSVPGEIIIFGTLSWFVCAYKQDTREFLWQQRVHEAVLSMQVFQGGESDQSNRLFAALADGTVAVFETISVDNCTNDLLYLPIGQSQVTCLQLIGNQLWCSCGNTISIIHASTLDPMDRFTVSANPYDTVLSLVPALSGVWMSVKGSSVLELWDPVTLSCKMLYDTRTGRYPNLRKEDDTYFNNARITSILSLDHSVWVGTGEGTLITFDVFQQNKSPSDSSLFQTEVDEVNDGQSWLVAPRTDSDSYTRLLEVEKRVKDLYVQRLAAEGFSENKLRKHDRDSKEEGYASGNSKSSSKASKSGYCSSSQKKDKKGSSLSLDQAVISTSLGKKMPQVQSVRTNKKLVTTALQDDTAECVSQQDSGYSMGGSVSSPSTIVKNNPLKEVVNATKSVDETKNSTSVMVQQEAPSVYYLFRPDLDENKCGKTVGVEASASKFSSLTHVRVDSNAKKTFHDNSIGAMSEGTTTTCKSKRLERHDCFDNSLNIGGVATALSPDIEMESGQMQRAFSADSVFSVVETEDSNTLECCVNTSCVFYSNTEGHKTAHQHCFTVNNPKNEIDYAKTERNLVSQNSGYSETTTLTPSEESKKISNLSLSSEKLETLNNMVNQEKHKLSSYKVIEGQTKNFLKSKLLGSNERSFSEDSNKTTGSDEVFCTVDDVHSNPKTTFFLSDSSLDALQAENDNISEKVDTTNSSRKLTSLQTNFKQDDTTNMISSLNEPERFSNEGVDSHSDGQSNGDQSFSVRSLAAQFESKSRVVTNKALIKTSFDKAGNVADTDMNVNDTADSTATENSARKNTNQYSQNHTTKSKERVGRNVRPRSLRLSKNGQLQICSDSLNKDSKCSKLTENLVTSDLQKKSGSDVEPTEVKGDKKEPNSNQNEKSNTSTEQYPSHIDTKFYGDSDEESIVHEARVQSFKNSYRKFSNTSLMRFKPLTEMIPENDLSSDSTPNSGVAKPFPPITQSSSSKPTRNLMIPSSGSSSDLSSITLKTPVHPTVSRQNSDSSSIHDLKSRDSEAQWRLDYTNVHVFTDQDSQASMTDGGVIGESESLSTEPHRKLSGLSLSSEITDERLTQFLTDTMTSLNSQFGHTPGESCSSEFLTTPTRSGCHSVNWSSYEEISTPPNDPDRTLHSSRPSIMNLDSRSTSLASTVDLYYGADLSLLSKNKISDKPVKWLIATQCYNKPVVLSFSGNHKDDEAVLLWSRDVNETLWTNSPIFEYNPQTRTSTLPRYMRPHMSSSSSNVSSPKQ